MVLRWKSGAVMTRSGRLGDTAAAFLAFTCFVDGELVQQTAIDPSPGNLLVLDLNAGKPVPVSVYGVTKAQMPKAVATQNHPLSAGLQPTGLHCPFGSKGAVMRQLTTKHSRPEMWSTVICGRRNENATGREPQ